jgi:hypothetical protein
MSLSSEPAGERPDPQTNHHLSPEYAEFVDREATAARIELYHALCVPGILQTETYARAATSAIVKQEPDHPGVIARVDVRMSRQRRLAERAAAGHAPQLVAGMDEAVLRRPVGGPDVMRQQLDRLRQMMDEQWITVVIVPLDLDGHPGLGGIFELLSFDDDSQEPDLVFVESAVADFLLRAPEVTRSYRDTISRLVNVGLTGDRARSKIEEIRNSW